MLQGVLGQRVLRSGFLRDRAGHVGGQNCRLSQGTIAVLIILSFALEGYVCPLRAAQTQGIDKFNSFAEWCLNKDKLSEAARHTVTVVLGKVETSDCHEANNILSKFTDLNLNFTEISDLKPLSSLTNLTVLQLRANQISDLSPLSSLTNLNGLDLGGNQITNLKPLSSLTNLNGLHLGGNKISDLSSLSSLTNLTYLDLGGNQISNLSPISNLTNLTSLLLTKNQISNLSPLSNLTNLTDLRLGYNQVSNLSPLSNLSKLSTLALNGNQISNLSPLSNLSKLSTLHLNGNQISNLSPLSNLTNLTNLQLDNNQISDLTPLSNLIKLSSLALQNNQISDLRPLSSLTNLNYLPLRNNKIRDIRPLSRLANLNRLLLENNPLVQKNCPLTPITICSFSDDGEELYDRAQKQYQQGQFLAALSTFQSVLASYQKSGDRQRQGDILNQIGDSYSNLGQYARALEFYQQALSLRQQLADSEGEVATLVSLSITYERIGQYQRTLEVLEQILQLRSDPISLITSSNTRIDGGKLFNSLASAYNKLGNYAEALRFSKLALTFYRKRTFEFFSNIAGYRVAPESRYGEANALDAVGVAYFRDGQPERGLKFLERALERTREIRDQAGVGRVLNHMGDILNSLGQTQKSLEFYQQALPLRQAANDIAGQGETLNNLGLLYFARGQYDKAETALFKAIAVLEALRPGLKDDEKIAIFETQAVTYQLLQKVLIAQNKFQQALEISDRARARAFVELLAQRVTSSNDTQVTPLTIEQIQRIAKEEKATIVEYSLVYDKFKVNGKQQPKESELYIWVIKPTGDVTFRKADLKPLWQKQNTSLADLVISSRDSIGVRSPIVGVVPRPGVQQRQEANLTQQLQQLHKLLIEPIADQLPTDPNSHVIFIPQRELFLAPFGAFQDKKGKYLIEKHTILTAPSIQVLELTHQQRQRVGTSNKPQQLQDALVVGNPTMPSVRPTFDKPPQQLPALPGAEREAQAIAPLLNTKALIGNDATKTAIVQLMPKARIIHLATHGLLDEDRGIGSAIALAPSDKDDGLLTAEQILGMNLNAELVVLSACNTGRGRITGDGVVGLSRSLISAGAQGVIVSLWSVPDAPTALLMTEFYRNWQQNPNKAIALRQAMLTTLKQHPDPKDWAAFTLIGEAE